MNRRIEPSAAMLTAMIAVKEMYEAAVDAGFTETQALTLVSKFLAQTIANPNENKDKDD